MAHYLVETLQLFYWINRLFAFRALFTHCIKIAQNFTLYEFKISFSFFLKAEMQYCTRNLLQHSNTPE